MENWDFKYIRRPCRGKHRSIDILSTPGPLSMSPRLLSIPAYQVQGSPSTNEHNIVGRDSTVHETGISSTSNFVRKLYEMLENPKYRNVVYWGLQGDCLVVEDTKEFERSILPRVFKHSNFSSFVRQLNKYDFHKVKTDDEESGGQSCTFRHPNFHAGRPSALGNIKRKQRKSTSAFPSIAVAPSQVEAQNAKIDSLQAHIATMEAQIVSLGAAHNDALSYIRRLDAISYIRKLACSHLCNAEQPSNIDMALQGVWSTGGGDPHTGMEVCGVQQLMQQGNFTQHETIGNQDSTSEFTSTGTSSSDICRSGSGQPLHPPRSAFAVPGWATPPRVLLVDDDIVTQKLCSKFLQLFGCMPDVAVDGVSAVDRMNIEKYDLVLMDIVMPQLDGVSATSIIRTFDPCTPIISMTSNSRPSDIITYYSSGLFPFLSYAPSLTLARYG
ncbi:HSF-type DNA-binding-domain-containing protein [Mycena maculata]|uniref:Transcription factor n=1 Tax=Mycena maculata TaxID=230809 RepID=A0AAD7NBB9_9AGAR|nr:HSF-type DNA-binding-domain-containing protein [Mycena maculata]